MRFSDIIGQIRVKNLLVQAVRNNRVSHAQLFAGPRGSGKLQLAIAYGQFVSCENKQFYDEGPLKGDSCGTCPSCVKYAKLAHPDLHFFFPLAPLKESKKPISRDFLNQWRELAVETDCLFDVTDWLDKIGIENKQGVINAEDCNEMSKTLTYKAYESEYKVVIIWHAEKLYHAAAPKILKILEEPPERTLFILISENTDIMLSTILSRTQIIKIPRFNPLEISHYLTERFSLTEAAASKISLLCEGDIKMAISLVDDSEDEDYNFLTLRAWYRLCFLNNLQNIVVQVEEISKIGRERQKALLLYGLRVTRRCMMFHYKLDHLVKLEGEELEFVQNLAPYVNPMNAETLVALFNESIYHIERNANPKILFMDLSVKLVRLLKIKQDIH